MNGNIPEDDWLGRVEGLSDDNTEAPDTGKHRIHLPKIPKPVDKPKPAPDEPEESGQPEKPDGIPAISPESIPEEKPVIHRPARKMTFLRENGVRSDMTDMIIALLPLAAWGVYLYGARVITLVLISVIFSVLFDYLTPVVLKKPDTVSDLSGAVIGLMTALLMPASAPPLCGSRGGHVYRISRHNVRGAGNQNEVRGVFRECRRVQNRRSPA